MARRVNKLCEGLALACLCAVALGAAGAVGGCYQRTIRATGLGADRYDVSEPYQENSRVDNWLFGEQRDPRERTGTRLK